MTLLDKLLGYLPPTFDKSTDSFLAFQISHTSSHFRWSISDRVFYGFDLANQIFAVSLAGRTIRQIIEQLLMIDGVGISNVSGNIDNSALTLLPPAVNSDPSMSYVYAYTSLLYALMDSIASELCFARYELVQALDQMSISTADGEWIDVWGDYFGITRNAGEPDRDYGVRIIAEVILPRENNIAISSAIRLAFGQDAEVVDAVVLASSTYFYDGVITYNGAHTYDAFTVDIYGLFDVTCAYNLESSLDQSGYAAAVRVFIEKFRAAGTNMRSLLLGGTVFSDSVSDPSDAASMTVHLATRYNGSFLYNNIITYSGDFPVSEVLS